VTLHRSLGITGRSANLVLVDDGATAAFLRGLQRDLDCGELTLDQAARIMLAPPATRQAKAVIGGLRLRCAGPLPRMFAWVSGTIDGRPAVAGCHVTTMPHGMAGATSIPATLAVAQVLERAPSPGVHAPEAVIDEDRLLTDLAPFCLDPVGDADALAPVVVTTDR
jgi:hypothetical protein